MEESLIQKYVEKLRKYQQLAFETREKGPRFRVNVVPLVIGSFGGESSWITVQVLKLIAGGGWNAKKRTAREMQKVVVMKSEIIMRKIMSGDVQPG